MPFDGSGNFTRSYNFTADKNAAIKIQSSRMDGEFDNFATAMNQAFLRNGVAPLTGNLNLATNTILNVGSGIVSTPSIRFSTDSTTGFYLPAAGQVSMVAGGVDRIRASSSGAAITGAITISSDGTISGNLSVTGNATISGTSTFTGLASFGSITTTGAVAAGLSVLPGLSRVQNAGDETRLGILYLNGYNDGTTQRAVQTGYTGAINFDKTLGIHQWYNTAASSAGGAAVSFAERMRLDVNGNVGINVTSMAARLHVAGNVSIGSQANVAAVFGQGSTSDLMVGSISGANPFIASQGANPLSLYTNAAERMRIDSAGNVGIGTPSPQAALHVMGAQRIDGALPGVQMWQSGVFCGLLGTSNAVTGSGSDMALYATGGRSITFFTNGSTTEKARIDGAGNFALGTTSPGATMHVVGGGIRIDNTSSQGRFEIYSGASSYGGIGTTGWVQGNAVSDIAINATAGRVISFFTNGSTVEKMRLDTNGNLGVGAPSPVNTANYGGITVGGTSGSIISGMVNGVEKSRIVTDVNFSIGSTTAIPTLINTNSTTRMVILANGETYLTAAQSPSQAYDVGYLGVPQSGGAVKTASYTAVLSDAGQHIPFNGTALTGTIPSNAAVAYPIGTMLMFVNTNASALAISINSDTLTLVNSTTTGTRSLAQNGIATAIKVGATSWLISGAGLS